MKTYICAVYFVVTAFSLSCSGNEFGGGSTGSGGKGSGNGSPKNGRSNPGANGTGDTISSPSPGGILGSGAGGSSVDAKCTINLSYDPQSVQCSIPHTANHVWRGSGGWSTRVSMFTDTTAFWISPLSAASRGAEQYCPYVPGAEKLIYVSNVTIPSAGAYTIETIIDDVGSARLWKGSNPATEAYSGADTASPKSVTLEAAKYAIVIDATDTGQLASGIVMSMRDSTGKVIKHSATDSSWCIFRVSAATDVKTFVPQAAGCRPCFGVTN